MDDKYLFGEVLHKLNFSDAIKQGILSDYQVSIVGVENQEISRMIRVRDLIRTHENFNFDSESLGTLIGLIKSIKKYKLRKLISFHNLIKNADIFSQIFPIVTKFFEAKIQENLGFDSDFVSGKMNSTEKDDRIQKLNLSNDNFCFILSNARCLSEGVDVPSLDGVAFIDPKHSPIDIVQAVGRAIRKSDNKTKGTIIVPVFLDEIENIDEKILATKFETVWNVILALKSQDDELLEMIDNLRIQLGSKNITKITSKGLEKIHFDLPANINPKFYDSLYTVLVENTSDDWLERYGEVKNFFSEKDRYPAHNEENGNWCNAQRMLFKKNKLLNERRDLLLKLDNWSWDLLDTRWLEKFEELKEYMKNNNGKIPKQDGKGYNSLVDWISNQRSLNNKGTLDSERFKLLDSLDGWEWTPFDERFDSKFKKLKVYLEENDNKFPPLRTKILGPFMGRMRREYRQNILDKKKIDLFNSLPGWSWDPKEDAWKEKFEGIKKYWEENEYTFPNTEHPEFGEWINTQRSSYKNNTLDDDKIQKLENLHGWKWNDKDPEKDWMNQYKKLVNFLKDNNNQFPKKGNSLASWMGTQRKREIEGDLPKKQYELLNNIGFKWGNQIENRWQKQYEDLSNYLSTNNNVYPKFKSKSGRWVAHQKEYNISKKLSKSRKIQLEKLPNWSW